MGTVSGTKTQALRAIRLERDADRAWALSERVVDEVALRIAPAKMGDVLLCRDRAQRLLRYKVTRVHGTIDRLLKQIRWQIIAHRVTKVGGYRGGERRFGVNTWTAMNVAVEKPQAKP